MTVIRNALRSHPMDPIKYVSTSLEVRRGQLDWSFGGRASRLTHEEAVYPAVER